MNIEAAASYRLMNDWKTVTYHFLYETRVDYIWYGNQYFLLINGFHVEFEATQCLRQVDVLCDVKMWSISFEDGMRFVRCDEYKISRDSSGMTITLLFVPEGGGGKCSWWYFYVDDFFPTFRFRFFVVGELLTQHLHSLHRTLEDFFQFQVDNLHNIRSLCFHADPFARVQWRWVCYSVDQITIRTVRPKDTVVDLEAITTELVRRKVTIW